MLGMTMLMFIAFLLGGMSIGCVLTEGKFEERRDKPEKPEKKPYPLGVAFRVTRSSNLRGVGSRNASLRNTKK
ncbi:MAG: hypothetical protein LBL34_01370 [Clostridiales bacterium]|jgi:hypothetical protein|nr:hypothetical protein [Clostridiales bacterium]